MGYKIEALDARTWLIEEEAMCNVYMYLLAGDREAVLLDTGYGTIPLDEITASLTDLPVSVLCTHGHFDHIGGNGYFSTVRMHGADRELYRQHRVEVRAIALNGIAPEAPEDLTWFEDSFTMDLGGRVLEIIPTPGHTRGCVSVLDRERRWLFTGDTCCKAAVLLNFDHSADLATYRAAVKTILDLGSRYDITWPSHHAKPVGKEIPQQFLTAADLLLEGKAQGKEVPGEFGPSRMFPYEDIMIMY